MPFADAAKLNPQENDVLECVDAMNAKLQRILDKPYSGEAFMCAMAFLYAEMVRARGGSEEPLSDAIIAFDALSSSKRSEVRLCRTDLRVMYRKIQLQGFGPDAIMGATIDAVAHILGQSGLPLSDIEACRDRMILQLNGVRKHATIH